MNGGRANLEAPPTIYVSIWENGKRRHRALYKLTDVQLAFLTAAIEGEKTRRREFAAQIVQLRAANAG